MDSLFFVEIENRVQGYGTRLKELHWSAPSISIHKLIDDFCDEFASFNDTMIEYLIPLHGTIRPGELNPVLPVELEFESLLESIRGMLSQIKKQIGDSMMYSGISSLVDDFYITVNKNIYLTQIGKGKFVDNNGED